jgi:hypothetical protein
MSSTLHASNLFRWIRKHGLMIVQGSESAMSEPSAWRWRFRQRFDEPLPQMFDKKRPPEDEQCHRQLDNRIQM